MRPTQRMTAGIIGGIPGAILTPHSREDVQRVQDAINRKALVIDAAASSCQGLDAATFQSWRLTGYVPAQQYVQQAVPSAINLVALNDMWEQGIALQGQLDAWAAKLSSMGCNVPLVQPKGVWADVATGAKWVGGTLIALGALALAIKLATITEDVVK